MSQLNAHEQYLLELINADRMQVGAQPLASNTFLDQAAEDHSQWMINTDIFSHTGAGGSGPLARSVRYVFLISVSAPKRTEKNVTKELARYRESAATSPPIVDKINKYAASTAIPIERNIANSLSIIVGVLW
jgi:hypothetical protein